jgi:ParB family transcriptional regulator, chromosome partitioning protein
VQKLREDLFTGKLTDQAYRIKEEMVAFQGSQSQFAESIGTSRSHVSNLIRLLNLPLEVQEMLDDGRLGMGQARALLGLPKRCDLVEAANMVIEKRMSARAVEQMVREKCGKGLDDGR